MSSVLIGSSIVLLAASACLFFVVAISQSDENMVDFTTQSMRYKFIRIASILAALPFIPALLYGADYHQDWLPISIVFAQIALMIIAALTTLSVYKYPSYLAKQVRIKDNQGCVLIGYVTTEDVRSSSKQYKVLKPIIPASQYRKSVQKYRTIGHYP